MSVHKIKSGYELSRAFWDYCFENPEKIKPHHPALYFFIIEHCNRLGWKTKFGLPTTMAMEAIGVKSYNTYSSTLADLIDWGFIVLVAKSKNQYSSNIVAVSFNNEAKKEANSAALDKAMIKHRTKHDTKQSRSTGESTDSIDKQINNTVTNKQITSNQQSTHFFELYDLDYFQNQGHNWEIKEPLRTAFDKFLVWRQTEHEDKKPITSATSVEEILKEFIKRNITPENGAAMVHRTMRKGWKNIIYSLDEDAPAKQTADTKKVDTLTEKW